MIAIPTGAPPSEQRFRFGRLLPVDAAGKQMGDAIPLLRSALLIGRDESCDIVLRFPTVSAQHCRMWLRDGHWYIEDLNTKNGTRANGARLHGSSRINDGDTIRVAKLCYVLRCPA